MLCKDKQKCVGLLIFYTVILGEMYTAKAFKQQRLLKAEKKETLLVLIYNSTPVNLQHSQTLVNTGKLFESQGKKNKKTILCL